MRKADIYRTSHTSRGVTRPSGSARTSCCSTALQKLTRPTRSFLMSAIVPDDPFCK